MNRYTHLRVNRVQDVLFVTLNCPDTRNALSPEVTAELYQVSTLAQTDTALRAIVLRGSQGFFCAGGNIGSFQSRLDAHQKAEPAQDPIAARNREFGRFLELWSALPVPIIAAVEGAAMGGGMGLAATCDICIAGDKAMFATSEVRLGLAPSTISPYVIRAIGERQAQRYFLTAERISAAKAAQIGLVHEVVDMDDLDAKVAEIVAALLLGGPVAQQASKELIALVAKRDNTPELRSETAAHIASLRAGQEAKEGLSAFLEKRAAAWCNTATSS